jgi:hypothetical protein
LKSVWPNIAKLCPLCDNDAMQDGAEKQTIAISSTEVLAAALLKPAQQLPLMLLVEQRA